MNRPSSSIENALGTSFTMLPEMFSSQSWTLAGDGRDVERPSNTTLPLTVAPDSSTRVTVAGVRPSDEIAV